MGKERIGDPRGRESGFRSLGTDLVLTYTCSLSCLGQSRLHSSACNGQTEACPKSAQISGPHLGIRVRKVLGERSRL